MCALLVSAITLSGAANVITFTTAKAVGEEVTLRMKYTGKAPTLNGMTGTPTSGSEVTYTLTSQTVTITGDVTYFDCKNNQLTALDVSNNTALTELYCSENQLTVLDLSQNSALTTLWCFKNQLTALDLPQNSALEYLYCSDNQLTVLDLSQNIALEGLGCYNNQLTALDLSKHVALKELDCYNNQLTALNFSQNTALTWLNCSNNQLTALDLSKNTELKKLNCYGNQIKGGKMTLLVNSLPDLSGKKTGSFIVVQEPAPEGNRCPKTDVAIAKGKNWKVMKINSESLITSDYEGAANVITFKTDKAVGETIVLAMEYTGNAPTLTGLTGTPVRGKEVTYRLTSQPVTITGDVTQFKCSNNKLTALDFSQNTALTWLDCSFNQLTALDSSQNSALETLGCAFNQLTALDLSQNATLEKLDCASNQLTALDLTQNTALTKLMCEENELTTLDVSPNTALTELSCYSNQLTALDLSKNTALTWLGCYGNQIKGEKMTQLMNSLPDWTSTSAGTIDVVQEPAPEVNRCLKTDVAIAKGKNWNTQKYKSDAGKYVPYEGEEPIPYAVTLTKDGEGTLDATGAADLNAVPEGTELTIVATPAEGYELTALTANGADILATKKVVVTGATEVKATFTKKTAADVVKGGSVRLYPNPAGTYVNVKAAKADALVHLYDANGSLQYEARTDANGTLQIDLSAYAEGTYLLRVGDDAQRLLIQR